MKNTKNTIKLLALAMLVAGAMACDPKKAEPEPAATTTVVNETAAPAPATETTATVASSTDTTATSATTETTGTTATTATQEKK
jgi:hypothetical protein